VGVSIAYAAQPSPEGLATGLPNRARFHRQARRRPRAGDNLFYGGGFPAAAKRAAHKMAHVFGLYVADLSAMALSSSMKRAEPSPSGEAESAELPLGGPGLYFTTRRIVDVAASIKTAAPASSSSPPSTNGICEKGALRVETPGRGFAFDTGTQDSLLDGASSCARSRPGQGLK